MWDGYLGLSASLMLRAGIDAWNCLAALAANGMADFKGRGVLSLDCAAKEIRL